MSSEGSKLHTGAKDGTGSAMNIRTVGFRPRVVEVTNSEGTVTAIWQDTMADASAFKRVTAGDATFITSNGITPLSLGAPSRSVGEGVASDSFHSSADVTISKQSEHVATCSTRRARVASSTFPSTHAARSWRSGHSLVRVFIAMDSFA